MTKEIDVIVVGGGILGCAVAMRLTKRGRTVGVIEKEAALAGHQTGHNSGVIHAGVYYKPGSAKATNCATGRELLIAFCEEHGITYDRCGKVVVALTEDELPRLDELERRGKANGLAGLRRIGVDELRDIEPHVAGIAGLHVAETGIVDYRAVTQAYARVAVTGGAEIVLGTEVIGIRREGATIIVETTGDTYRARCLVGCAGLNSDRLAKLADLDPGVQIVPFRGEYYELVESRRSLVRNLIYPVPDPAFPFLGVHFTRRLDGRVEAGPNAVLAWKREGYTRGSFSLADAGEIATFPGTWKLAMKHWRTGLGESWRSWSKPAFVAALQKLVPEVVLDDLVTGGAGVRAQAMRPDGSLVDDFHLVEDKGMVHVLNAPSPAATASLAIAASIEERAVKHLA